MKKFMQLLLVSFGVMALALSGCQTTPAEDTDDEAMMEDSAMEDTTMDDGSMVDVEADAMVDAK